VLLDHRPEELVVARHGYAHGLLVLLPQAGGPLDVREQKESMCEAPWPFALGDSRQFCASPP
jgi:hypothetical protein